jgi:predicted dehydrogenase
MVTAGHDDQFSHVARRMRTLVAQGYLGEAPVHMESYYCYPLGNSVYANAVLSDKSHWVRGLPGGLLQNIISHGIARIAEFMVGDSPQVIAHGFTSPALRRLGETEIIDELRVMIDDDNRSTAYFTFSSQMRPSLHEFRIYGSKNGLILNQDTEMLMRLRGATHKSYAAKFVPPLTTARQSLGNLYTNVRSFMAKDFHMKSGMKHLIEAFYSSIINGTPEPIPYREILLTARIMDNIFDQLATHRIGIAQDFRAMANSNI